MYFREYKCTVYTRTNYIVSLQGSKTKGALKGWGNFGDMTSTPKGATPAPNSSSASKTRPGMDNSTFAQFREAAKQKADR